MDLLAQVLVGHHAADLGQEQRGEAMAVHRAVRRGQGVVQEAGLVAAFLAKDEADRVGDDTAVVSALGLMAAGHEGQAAQAGHGGVARVVAGAERAVGPAVGGEVSQAALDRLVGLVGNHAPGGRAVGQSVVAVPGGIARQGQASAGRAEQGQPTSCQQAAAV